MTTTARCVMCGDIATHLSRKGNQVCDFCDPRGLQQRAGYHSGFEDVEPWDMTPEDAHPYNEPGPTREI